MSFVILHIGGENTSYICCSDYDSVKKLKSGICSKTGLSPDDFYVVSGGRRVGDDVPLIPATLYHVVPRLIGGKGGFGSMLRAIGAQIEKTTSREACRDLSGRRMRDVNNEKKLKEWMGKQSDRAKEKEQRSQERRERRKAMPNHKFDDPTYDQQKAQVSDNLEDAVSQGLAKAGTSQKTASCTVTLTSHANHKRKLTDEDGGPTSKKKAAEWLGLDADNLSDFDNDSENESRTEDPAVESSESTSRAESSSSPSDEDADRTSSSRHPDNGPIDENKITDDQGDTSALQEGKSTLTTDERQCHAEHDQKHGLLKLLNPPANENKGSGHAQEPSLINLDDFDSSEDLESVGLDRLKSALAERGMKCGGTLQERAKRLFSVKGLSKDQIDKLVVPGKKSRKIKS